MMARSSVLCDKLPDSITVGGERFKIYTDFRRWILLTEFLCGECGDDAYIDGMTAAYTMAMIVCPAIGEVLRKKPKLVGEFVNEIVRFVLMGGDIVGRGDGRGTSRAQSTPIYDFEVDGERIFASFMAVYGIDLTEADMHWWKFMSLLRCLPRDCAFMQVVDLRGLDVSRIADDGLRKQLRRARAAVRLPKKRSRDDGELDQIHMEI